MSPILEAVVPARLGRGFRWLLASSWSTQLGDGIAVAAGPLLVASQTHSPFLVSLAPALSSLPWLLFGLYAGALADRLDRRRIVMIADSIRALVLAGLAVVIVTGAVDITLVLIALFLLGLAELFTDATVGTLTPMLVDSDDLGIANARMQAGFITANQLVGPAIGASLFAAGAVIPFVTQGVLMALGVVLVSRIGTAPGGVREIDTHIRQDIVEGVRFLLGHDAIRTLAMVILVFNLTWAASWSVLVLYTLKILHMGPAGFGLLTTSIAIGGIVGTISFGRLEQRFRLVTLMRICLSLEVLLHLSLALNHSPAVAFVIMFVFGLYAFVWGTLSQSVRQRVVPTQFQGRVGSAYMMGVVGGMFLGSLLGGVIAQVGGLTAPFWFAFIGSALTLALVWRQLNHIAREGTPVDFTTRPDDEDNA